MADLDSLTYVLLRLDAGRTRATYGAVAGLLECSSRSVMSGRPRDPLHSWVVNKKTGRPTHYTEAQQHPDLLQTGRVIADKDELAAFLGGWPATA